jgi:hypothetical protein
MTAKTPRSRERPRPTAQGVNANASKQHLVDVARRLAISRPDRLNKTQLVAEIERANRRATSRAQTEQP